MRSQLMNADRISAGENATSSAVQRRDGPAQYAVASTPATRNSASTATVTSKKCRPLEYRFEQPVDRPGCALHDGPDDDRVLDVVVEVGHLACRQALDEVQRVDVGVAVGLVLRDADVPRPGPARLLGAERDAVGGQARQDEDGRRAAQGGPAA